MEQQSSAVLTLALSTLSNASAQLPAVQHACESAVQALRSGARVDGQTLWRPWALFFGQDQNRVNQPYEDPLEGLECLTGLISGGAFRLVATDSSMARDVVITVCKLWEPEEEVSTGMALLEVVGLLAEAFPSALQRNALPEVLRMLCGVCSRCSDPRVQNTGWELAANCLKQCYSRAVDGHAAIQDVEAAAVALCRLVSEPIPPGSLHGCATVQRAAIALQLLKHLITGPPNEPSLFTVNSPPSAELCQHLSTVLVLHSCSLVPTLQGLLLELVTSLCALCSTGLRAALGGVLLHSYPEMLRHPLVSMSQRLRILEALAQIFKSQNSMLQLWAGFGEQLVQRVLGAVQQVGSKHPECLQAALEVCQAALSSSYKAHCEQLFNQSGELLLDENQWVQLLAQAEGWTKRSPLTPIPSAILGVTDERYCSWVWRAPLVTPFEPTCYAELSSTNKSNKSSVTPLSHQLSESLHSFSTLTAGTEPPAMSGAVQSMLSSGAMLAFLGQALHTGLQSVQCLKAFKVVFNSIKTGLLSSMAMSTLHSELIKHRSTHFSSTSEGLYLYLCELSSETAAGLSEENTTEALYHALGLCSNAQVGMAACAGSEVWMHAAYKRHLTRLQAESKHLPKEVESLEIRIRNTQQHVAFESASSVIRGLDGLVRLQVQDLHALLASTSSHVLALLSHAVLLLPAFCQEYLPTSQLPGSRGARANLATPLLQALRQYSLPSTIHSPPTSPHSPTPVSVHELSSPRLSPRSKQRWSAKDSIAIINSPGSTPRRASRSPTRQPSPSSGLVRSALKQELGARSSKKGLFRSALKQQLASSRTPGRPQTPPSALPPANPARSSSPHPLSRPQSPVLQRIRANRSRSPASPSRRSPSSPARTSHQHMAVSATSTPGVSPRKLISSTLPSVDEISTAMASESPRLGGTRTSAEILLGWVKAVHEYTLSAPKVRGYWQLLNATRELKTMRARIEQCNIRKVSLVKDLSAIRRRVDLTNR